MSSSAFSDAAAEIAAARNETLMTVPGKSRERTTDDAMAFVWFVCVVCRTTLSCNATTFTRRPKPKTDNSQECIRGWLRIPRGFVSNFGDAIYANLALLEMSLRKEVHSGCEKRVRCARLRRLPTRVQTIGR